MLGRYAGKNSFVVGALVLFICAGMHLSFAIFNPRIWNSTEPISTIYAFVIASFFFGGIIGAVLSGYLIAHVGRRNIQYWACIFTLASGALHIFIPYSATAGLIVAKVIAGLGYGFLVIGFVVYASETAYSDYRGYTMGSASLCLYTGVAMYTVLSIFFRDEERLHMGLGVMTMVDSLFSGGLIYVLSQESPLYLLLLGEYDKGKEALMNMRGLYIPNEGIMKEETEKERAKRKREEKMNSRNVMERIAIYKNSCEHAAEEEWQEIVLVTTFSNTSRISGLCHKETINPIIGLQLLRIAHLMTFNYALNAILGGLFNLYIDSNHTWLLILIIGLRIIGILISMLTVDSAGRKRMYALSSITTICLLILAGISFILIKSSHMFSDWLLLPFTVLIVIQFSAGLGVSPLPDIMAGELFPFTSKCMSTAITCVIEFSCQILCLLPIFYHTGQEFISDSNILFGFTFGSSCIMLLTYLWVSKKLPETKHFTFRDCHDLF